MSFSRPPSRFNPKISTMPRQQSESSHYLSIYKLTVQKKRLQQELDSLAKRRDLLQNRLATLEQEMAALNNQAQTLGTASAMPQSSLSEPNSIVYPPTASETTDPYKTVTLDY